MSAGCDALHSLMYRHSAGVLIGTKCSPIVADFFYERYFMLALSDNNQADVVEFQSTSLYLDKLLSIDKGR